MSENMVGTFVTNVTRIIQEDCNSIVILSGIRQFSFRNAKKIAPKRVIDLGIMEQNAVGVAAGLSVKGFIPFLHTWTPFLIERAFDQIRLFCHQDLSGNFIGTGNSYDLTDFGDSHYCPECIPLLKQMPNMEIVVPGTSSELSSLLTESYNDNHPTYFHLSTIENKFSRNVAFGKANVLKKGKKGTILVVGSMLNFLENYLDRLDASIIYYTTIEPFDSDTLINNLSGEELLICEPYNESAIVCDVLNSLDCKIHISFLCMNKNMNCELGSFEDNLQNFKLDSLWIEKKLDVFLISSRNC